MKRLKIILIEFLSRLPIRGYMRGKLYSFSPIKFNVPKNEKCKIFIGKGVLFDALYPENIEIGNYTTIATGCIILSHFLDMTDLNNGYKYKKGQIIIGRNTLLFANVIIAKSVKIGDNVIVGAGSVVTKDIPDNELWAGVPAKFIKKLK